MSLLRLEHVSKSFRRGNGPEVRAVDDVSLAVDEGETLALIGESGSGKSTVIRLALGLQRPDAGTIEFAGQNMSTLDKKRLRELRSQMTIVFQEPYESLNPRMTVGQTIAEPLVIHRRDLTSAGRREQVIRALEQVSLNASFHDRYPHQLSGGQQQRVGIARAIVTQPRYVALDEPTSGLDLSVRAQILQLLADLKSAHNLAFLYVSHDIHTVEFIADRICVMYLGRIVESGPTEEVFRDPRHPYTQALLSSTLSVDPTVRKERVHLGVQAPDAARSHPGCPLYGRCPIGTPECTLEPVELHPFAPGHDVACLKVPAREVVA